MARAKAGINAPLTLFLAVLYGQSSRTKGCSANESFSNKLISLHRNNNQSIRNKCSDKAEYAFKVLVLDEWLMPELSKADVEFILELTERRFDSTSTIFCTLYKREDWVKRLRGGTYAESIVERFAHNTTWIETGDVNMRQYLSHA